MTFTPLFSALVDLFYDVGNFLHAYLQNNVMINVATLSILVIYSKDWNCFVT